MPPRTAGQTFPLLYRCCIGSLTNPLRSGSDGAIFNELRIRLAFLPGRLFDDREAFLVDPDRDGRSAFGGYTPSSQSPGFPLIKGSHLQTSHHPRVPAGSTMVIQAFRMVRGSMPSSSLPGSRPCGAASRRSAGTAERACGGDFTAKARSPGGVWRRISPVKKRRIGMPEFPLRNTSFERLAKAGLVSLNWRRHSLGVRLGSYQWKEL